MSRTGYSARWLAVVGVAALVAGPAVPATAAPSTGARLPAAVQAAALPEATELEKVRALAAIGIVADGEWLILPDRGFVSRLLTDAKSAPLLEVRTAARAALDVDGSDAATLFIRSGIFVAVEKDEARIRQEQLAKQQAREAKQRALAYLEIPATSELLDLPDDQFIRRVGALVTWEWGTRVQAGVNTALRGEAPQWKAFIEAGVITAHRADVEAYIQAQHDKTEAEKEALRQKDLKRRAASVVAWAPTEGELTLANDNFIRKIREKAVAGSEVSAAAFDAIMSPEPAAWAAFIETGIHAASARDKQIALDKEIAENRKLALEIQTKAEKTLVRPALVAAAKAALAGTPADVALFLRAGQFDALAQSIRTTTPKRAGWWVRSAPGDASLTSGDSAGAQPAPIADVTWKVVDGLGDTGCFSFESKERAGHYLRPTGLRVQLQPSDGSTEFKNAATWCAKKGLGGAGVSLEAKSQPGRYLRHLGTELWIADNSGDHAFDRACAYQPNATWQVDGPNPQATVRPGLVRPECIASCPQAVPTFVVRNDGQLRLYQHADPLNGGFSWVNASGEEIGQGWLGARTVAGPDGVVYAAVDNGELRRLRWNGTGWDVTNGAQYKVIDRGWGRYATAPYRNRITVDTKGDIYTVEPDGRLHWRSYKTAGAGTWEHRTLDGDWSGYDLIVAAGTGVIYARTPGGDLFRYHYDAVNHQWAQQAEPAGHGWQMFNSIFSVGADILYGAHAGNGGELLWYRYLPATGTWVDTGRGVGKLVGTGWHGEYNLTAAPDGCELS
jgi:hypothetical protein